MRNLKRALSLTLASVMLLGMMVVGAGAASYPDVDSNDNIEAIEVLQAVQVMRGDENGNFDPDRNVTRAEMAVVMALLLDLDYQYYEAACPFNDVAAWARPYVGACYANGIVSGYDATTYGSNDGVTPVQAASMMMRALGYFQYASDYKDGFETATVRQGTRIGIFNDVGSSASAAMTRNQVAQMALNALECTMVDAEQSMPNISVGSGDTAVNIEGQVNYVVRTSRENFAYAINRAETSSVGTNGVNGATIELGEQLYNGDLKKETFEGAGVLDAFGAPATRWVYKTTEIGTYADEADAVYTAEVKSKDIYSDLGLSGTVTGGSNVDDFLFLYEDGIESDYSEFPAVARSGANGDKKLGGNGVLVKAYKYEATYNNRVYDAVVISVINTYLAQVDGAYNSDNGELELDVLHVTPPAALDDTTLSDDDFGGLSSFSDGDYVLVTVGSADGTNQEIMTIAAAETLTGEVDRYTQGTNVTVDGNVYRYSKTFYNNVDGNADKDTDYEIGRESRFILDSYGYIIGLDEANGSSSYVYIDEFDSDGKYSRNETYYADAYFTDGTNEDITLNKIDNQGLKGTVPAEGNTITLENDASRTPGWYKYSTTSDNKYNLTSINPSEDEKKPGAVTATGTTIVENGKTNVVIGPSASDTLRGNNSTVFIIRNGNDVYAYTGIKEVATVTTDSDESKTKVAAVKSGSYASYVFIDVGNGDLEGAGTASGDAIFILNATPQNNRDRDGVYYTYDAILNGRKIAKTADNAVRTDDVTNFPAVGLYTEVYYDDNGMVTKAHRVTEPLTDDDYGFQAFEGATIQQKGQTLIFDDGVTDADVYLNGFIRLIEDTDVTTVTPNSLARMFNGDDAGHQFTGNVWATFKDGDATGVYVEVTEGGEDDDIPVEQDPAVDTALNDVSSDNLADPDTKPTIEMASQTDGVSGINVKVKGLKDGKAAKIGYKIDDGTGARVLGEEKFVTTGASANGEATATIPAVGSDAAKVVITSFEVTEPVEESGVTSVTVSAADDATEVVAGETLQFSAEVVVTGDTAQTVVWTVAAADAEGETVECGDTITISEAGLLTVDESVSVGTVITVTATSTVDESKSGDAAVTVAEPEAVAISDVAKFGTWPTDITGEVDVDDDGNKVITITMTESWTPSAEDNADMIGGADSSTNTGASADTRMWVGVKISFSGEVDTSTIKREINNGGSKSTFADVRDNYVILWVSVAEKTESGGETTWTAKVDASEGDGDVFKLFVGDDETVIGTFTVIVVDGTEQTGQG